MKIYIDFNYCCHTTNPDNIFKEIEIDFFNDKCDTFIEGYRFVPAGEAWTRNDGVVFNGEMISPWKPYDELAAVQRKYKRAMLAQQEVTIAELDALVLNLQYNNLIK